MVGLTVCGALEAAADASVAVLTGAGFPAHAVMAHTSNRRNQSRFTTITYPPGALPGVARGAGWGVRMTAGAVGIVIADVGVLVGVGAAGMLLAQSWTIRSAGESKLAM